MPRACPASDGEARTFSELISLFFGAEPAGIRELGCEV
jgi:hypothetical protein